MANDPNKPIEDHYASEGPDWPFSENNAVAPVGTIKGEGSVDRLPRFNVRLTAFQIEVLMGALDRSINEFGTEADFPNEKALQAALSIVANTSPPADDSVIADVTLAPEVTWHRPAGEAGSEG